jgi:calnexin
MFLASFVALSASSDLSAVPRLPTGGYFHFQSFGDLAWRTSWTITGLENYTGKWETRPAAAPQALPGEELIFMTTEKSYYGLSTAFKTPLNPTDQTLVLQYEVRQQESLQCGGLYIKLFGDDNYAPATLCNETRYLIMFGPDRCGSTNKVHFIFRHANPKSGVIEEKHLKDPPTPKTDKNNHLYTLIVRPDNSFEILIDAESVKQGSLLTDFVPSVNPPKEIDDPTDSKPSDWVDNEKMPDPDATKPDDWDESQPEFVKDPAKLDPPEGWLPDEPKFVPDPAATKPEDWDDDIHGEWEPQTIPNPKCEAAPGCGEYEPPLVKNSLYKGKWRAPLIANPAYKGVWKARQIANPDYVEDLHPHNFGKFVGAGFELWMVNKEVGFNNVWIGTDEAAVHRWNKEHFIPKFKAQEEEQKKLEPKRPKPGGEKGFLGTVQKFAASFAGAITNLFEENLAAGVALVALVVAVPIVLVICLCRTGRAEPEDDEGEPEAEETKEKEDEEKEGKEDGKDAEKEEEEKAEPEEPKEKVEEGKPRQRGKKPVEDNY